MSDAMNRLREGFEERGVEYDGRLLYETEWTVNGITWRAKECDGMLNVYVRNNGLTLTPEQAIAATLGDGDYELKMDELLCRLTNGKWSKTRSYSVDFMVSCVDEAYEDATLGTKRDRTEEWLLNACNNAANDYIAELERKLKAATLGNVDSNADDALALCAPIADTAIATIAACQIGLTSAITTRCSNG